MASSKPKNLITHLSSKLGKTITKRSMKRLKCKTRKKRFYYKLKLV
jgi:hypothetical protein